MQLIIVAVGSLLLLVHGGFACEQINVTTSSGQLLGCQMTDGNGTKWNQYLGIPYAQPPVGELRFAPTKPVEPWTKIRNSTTAGKSCIQFPFLDIPASVPEDQQDEDCLFLNVIIPDSNDTKLAVMIFIHGGGFAGGSGAQYSGLVSLPVQGNVIMVTLNYRLGPLGFLSTGDSLVPGNMGLWDSLEAIRWVKRNTAVFGGDPDRITIFGESAGSIMVSFLTVTPETNGQLFHRAIMQSGTMHTQPDTFDSAADAVRLAQTNNCTGTKSEMVNCLKTLPVKQLSKNMGNFTSLPVKDGRLIPYSQCDVISNTSAFVRQHGQYDIMVGHNSQEGLLFLAKLKALSAGFGLNLTDEVQKSVYDYAFTVEFGPADGGNESIEHKIREFYDGQEYGNTLENRTTAEKRFRWYTEAAGDRSFVWPSLQFATQHSQKVKEIGTSAKTYFYSYDYRRPAIYPANWWEGPDWLRVGADHADELRMVFGVPLLESSFGKQIPAKTLALSQKLVELWTNFARFGNPTPNISTPQWKQFDASGELNYALFNSNGLNRMTDPRNNFTELWDTVRHEVCSRSKPPSTTVKPDPVSHTAAIQASLLATVCFLALCHTLL